MTDAATEPADTIDPLTDDEIDLTFFTAHRACQEIIEDESSEEYFAGFCEDAIPMLKQIRLQLHAATERAEEAEAERARYRAVVDAAKAVANLRKGYSLSNRTHTERRVMDRLQSRLDALAEGEKND